MVENVPRHKGFRGHQSRLGGQPTRAAWKAKKQRGPKGHPLKFGTAKAVITSRAAAGNVSTLIDFL